MASVWLNFLNNWSKISHLLLTSLIWDFPSLKICFCQWLMMSRLNWKHRIIHTLSLLILKQKKRRRNKTQPLPQSRRDSFLIKKDPRCLHLFKVKVKNFINKTIIKVYLLNLKSNKFTRTKKVRLILTLILNENLEKW